MSNRMQIVANLESLAEMAKTVLSRAPEMPKQHSGYRRFSEVRTDVAESLIRSGKTLEEVGSLFGITKERVRQLLAYRGLTSPQIRPRPVPPPLRFPIPGFRNAMYRHLRASGYEYCAYGKHVVCPEVLKSRICRECNNERLREYRKTGNCRQYMKEYIQRPDVKEKHNAYKAAWQRRKMQEDPEYAQKKKGYIREYAHYRYHTDPEFREKTLADHRRRYAARKEAKND